MSKRTGKVAYNDLKEMLIKFKIEIKSKYNFNLHINYLNFKYMPSLYFFNFYSYYILNVTSFGLMPFS